MKEIEIQKQRIMTIFLVTLTLFVSLLIVKTPTVKAEAVNSYISAKKIKPAGITTSVWNGFPKYKYDWGYGRPEGVVVHETANASSTIYNEIAYMKANYNNAFVHSFVDADHIINIANTNYLAWGVGYPGNGKFVQFEQIEVHSKSAFAHEISNAAWYTAYLLNKYNLTPNDACYDGKGTVWSHKEVAQHFGGSSHTDPYGYYINNGRKYFGQGYTMAEFYQLTKKYYEEIHFKNVKYTNAKLTMDVKSAPGHDFYNHVPESKYTVKRLHYGKTYAGKTIQIDCTGKRDGTGTLYYRCYYNGKEIGWIYGGGLAKHVSYSATNQTMDVKVAASNDFYNHVTSSMYTNKRLHYGKTYAGKTVTIDNVAYRDGTKTPYYRCYYQGKRIGWIYGGGLAVHVTYKSINTKQTMTVKAAPGPHDFLNHVTGSKYTVKRLNYSKDYAGKQVTVDNVAYRTDYKTPCYRCYYNGKEIGWIFGSALN
ncbi:Bifunctional autolysin Atl [Pediococcus damnosus]|uniref:GW dipeptide domain-containing protein n=1 Tax=Pediococcus damnosus TaxID=51663 RepID=UPI00078CF464|nr:GW dipeptide domain-containing protein [Pediococcus damnosus]AMV68691.1 Bifunctional autolysin Atl [Pediococcus damnosus]